MDTASAARRLAFMGGGFGTAKEVAKEIKLGVAKEFVHTMMAALQRGFECLRGEE
jgi:predicted Rossmann-fold nucleotide-binding protein